MVTPMQSRFLLILSLETLYNHVKYAKLKVFQSEINYNVLVYNPLFATTSTTASKFFSPNLYCFCLLAN